MKSSKACRRHDLRGACSNAVVAHPAGILQGVDQQHTGRVERVDVPLLKALLANDVVPVIPPLGCDGEGSTYRLNSDSRRRRGRQARSKRSS